MKMRKSQTGVKREISELSNVSSPFFFPFRTIVRFSNDDASTRIKLLYLFVWMKNRESFKFKLRVCSATSDSHRDTISRHGKTSVVI